MTIWFYIKVKAGKLLANLAAATVTDRERRHRLRNRLDPLNPDRCVSYLQRHYTQVAVLPPSGATPQEHTIWVCWLQGLEQAPTLVRNCVRSIERHKPQGWQVTVITADNYARYVELPAAVIEKWQQGRISNTHFSDLFRIHVLARHGGCWMDATCLLTAPVPQQILQSELFIFRTHGEFAYTFIQSCFMVSRPDHYVMRKWCAAMDAYWAAETMTINYFTLHLMFVALLRSDDTFSRAFSEVIEMSDEPAHLLLYAMMKGAPYSDDLMARATEAAFMQKLTYKLPPALLQDERSTAYHFAQQDLT